MLSTAGWTWLHKLRRAMVRPGRDRLSGRVEVDETYRGSEEENVRGRQTENKALIVIAAQDGDGIGRIRMRRIPDAWAESLMPFIDGAIEPRSRIRTDGWLGYSPLQGKGCPSPYRFSEEAKGIGIGAAPASSSGGLSAEALAAGHASRCDQPGTPGLLFGRVHISFQSAELV
jgi:hypothetical protein